MYQAFFALHEPPFSISPDPRFLFLGRHHQEALAHLLYSVRGSSGFILLTGEVGSGKTTLSRCLIQQTPDHVDIALIFNPRLTAMELIASICDELEISYPETASLKTLYDTLNQHLLKNYANNRTTLLLLDEAQNLSVDLLEQVRLLSNLETDKKKLLQIILIGQPELLDIMAQPDMRQFNQRVTARYHIAALTLSETREFIRHRLSVAGCQQPIFSLAACQVIHRAAKGIPRLLNQICDRALLGAYTLGQHRVDTWIAHTAAREVLGIHRPRVRRSALTTISAFSLLGIAAGVAIFYVAGDPVLRFANTFLHAMQTALDSPAPVTHAHPETILAGHSPQTIQPDQTTPVQPKKNPLSAVAVDQPAETDKPPVVAKQPDQTTPVQPQKTPLSAVAVDRPAETDKPPVVANKPPISLETLFNTPGEETVSPTVLLPHLFDLWGIPAEKLGRNPTCERASNFGMACKDMAGNWNTIRQLGIPVMLRFFYFDGLTRYALVTGLGRKTVALQFSHREEVFSLSEAERYWFGQISFVWRLTPAKKEGLYIGMYGEDVFWLSTQLARIQKREEPDKKAQVFDTELQQHVRKFQTQAFLDPDGMVGFRTMIAMDLAAQNSNRSTPKLRILND